MSAISGKRGQELLLAVINDMKELDPQIVPFDSDEVDDLEISVAASVRDVFGSGSPEYAEFEDFRIAAGHISRGDTRAEKQAKFEMGLPKAISRLEELVELMNRGENLKSQVAEIAPEDLVELGPEKKPVSPKSAGKKPSASTQSKAPAAPSPLKRETASQKFRTEPKARAAQPGKILLLQTGGDDITFAVTALMDKIGVDVVMLEEDSPVKVEEVASKSMIAFTLMCVSTGQKGGLSGLTAVIAKPRPKHEIAFKLGLLVGRLGAGKVAILYSGEKPLDVPEDLFGVLYLPYQEEGGWQIGLLKLLKGNGFNIDANLLFE
jgi:hypothetical protein